MKYEMPAEMPGLTDERREKMINWIAGQRDACDELHGDRCNDERCLASKIALAALTAEPADFSRACDAFRHVLYTAPPVPQMNSIVLNSDETDSPIDWYAGAKTRDMVIDTLRDAGYEVKE